jgi:hypothetical protein
LSINELKELKFIINITNDNILYQPFLNYKAQTPIFNESENDIFRDTLFPPLQNSITSKDNQLFNYSNHENFNQLKQLIFERPINIFKKENMCNGIK